MKRIILAAALASACGHASAVVVRHINTDPGFSFHPLVFGNDDFNYQTLDITKPVTEQPPYGTATSRSISITFFDPNAELPVAYSSFVLRPNGVEISYEYREIRRLFSGNPVDIKVPKLYNVGDAVGPDDDYYGYASSYGDIYEGVQLEHTHSFGDWQFISDTEPVFLGFHLISPEGTRYGYIEMIRIATPSYNLFHPLSWGYETEVGVPLVIVPAPSAAALLLGAGLVARRRR